MKLSLLGVSNEVSLTALNLLPILPRSSFRNSLGKGFDYTGLGVLIFCKLLSINVFIGDPNGSVVS